MTSHGAGRKGKRGDGAGRGWMDVMGWQQLHTIEPRQAPPLYGYLCQTNKWGGQRQTNAWHVSVLSEWQVKPLWVLAPKHWANTPGPRPPRWFLPYPTSGPTLRTICRGAPCRRPHDLIKCNYHQPLVLRGRRGVSEGETSCSRETNIHIFVIALCLSTCNQGIRPHIIPTLIHYKKKSVIFLYPENVWFCHWISAYSLKWKVS